MNELSVVKSILGKDLDDLRYVDLENYFKKERNESTRLEFKSFVDEKGKGPKTHLQEVFRSIAGMLNSEGGLIIWGAPKGVSVAGSKEKVFVGSLTHVDCDRDDDQLNSGILDNLSPMPPSIKFIKLKRAKAIAYVFEVPKSPYSPHQLRGTYWARFGAQTRTAPHYLVEALMRRISFPNIAAYVKLRSIQKLRDFVYVGIDLVCFNHSRLQNERNLVVSAVIFQGMAIRNGTEPPNTEISQNGRQVIYHEAAQILHYGMSRTLRLDVHFPIEHFGDGQELLIQVAIGGRSSPMKYSTYNIQVKPNEADLDSLIQPIKVNHLPDRDEEMIVKEPYKKFYK